MLYATVRQRKIHVKNPVTVIQNGIGVDRLLLEMDEEWKTMDSIVCVFVLQYTDTETTTENGEETEVSVTKEISREMLYTFGEEVQVPWECLTQTGKLSVSCTGYVGSEKVMTTMLPDSFWEVVQNGPVTGEVPMEPTPALYEQVLAAAGSANAAAVSANAIGTQLLVDKENGVFDGISPTVEVGTVTASTAGGDAKVVNSGTPTAVVLDFTLPRGGAGPKGKDGHTPQKGIDYLTQEEITALQAPAMEYARRMPYTNSQFGIALYEGKTTGLVDVIKGMTAAEDLGFHTCYVHSSRTDNPPSKTGSSFRGFVHITNNASGGDKLYAYILLVDDNGDIFTRYIKGGTAGDWKIHEGTNNAKSPFEPTAWAEGQHITSGIFYGDKVPAYAFKNWSKLSSVEFKKSITEIGDQAFYGCSSLAMDALPSGKLRHIGSWAFAVCKALTVAEIPAGVRSVGYSAFHGCTGLRTMTFKGRPTVIDSTVFNNCTNLTDIYVPWAEGEVAGAPWGAGFATVHYGEDVG